MKCFLNMKFAHKFQYMNISSFTTSVSMSVSYLVLARSVKTKYICLVINQPLHFYITYFPIVYKNVPNRIFKKLSILLHTNIAPPHKFSKTMGDEILYFMKESVFIVSSPLHENIILFHINFTTAFHLFRDSIKKKPYLVHL